MAELSPSHMADDLSGFGALSLEERIGTNVGNVVFVLLVALAIWHLERKYVAYDRDDEGSITGWSDMHSEVMMRWDHKLRFGCILCDLEAQFIDDMLPGTTKKPSTRPVPMAAVVREYRPRPRREESQGELTLMAGRGDSRTPIEFRGCIPINDTRDVGGIPVTNKQGSPEACRATSFNLGQTIPTGTGRKGSSEGDNAYSHESQRK
ncbi:hypothetical protein PG997_013337 [Apiospora hydei]|uniref:Uncharacterized protein n=1 Tax=Apiospora hydei TaxID=1337664 RepID=A0ABR1V8J5_9PEZI